MVAFEEKVIHFQNQNENFKESLIRGSDAHLDALIKIQTGLNNISDMYEPFRVDIIADLNRLSDEEVIHTAVPSLLDLYSSLIKLVAVLKRKKIDSDLKTCTQVYFSHVDDLRELISDLEFHRVNDDGLLEILNELNEA